MASNESEAYKYWAAAAGPRIAALCTSIRDDLSPSEMEARRRALTSESAAMRSFLWKFETSLNDLQPIMRLPTEIMTTIFMLVAESNPITGYPHNRRPYSYLGARATGAYVDWLPLTRVCRRWRAEALACSPLWGRIPLSLGTKGIDEFIKRSRDAALVIDCGHHDRYTHLGEMLQPSHVARAREIHLPTTALQGTHAATFLPLLTNPSPRLEVFAIRGGFAGAILRRRAAIKLPDNLFDNKAPLLRTLSANNVDRFPVQRSLFSNLRSFTVSNPNSHSGYVYPMRLEMYDTLRSMPLLEHLSLTNSMAREGSGVDAVPFDLPHLHELVLNGPVDGCASVLQPLRVKPRCKVTISTTDEVAAVRDKTTTLFGNLGRTGFNVDFAPKTLALTLLDGRLNVTAFDDAVQELRSLTNRVLSSPGNAHFALTIGFRRRASLGAAHMTRCVQELFARALPVQAVEMASVVAMAGTSDVSARQLFDPMWKVAFAPCTRLSGLYVAGPAAYVLLRTLSEPLVNPVLPALSSLVFDDNQISRQRLFEHIPLYNILLQALATRDIPRVEIPESPLLTTADMDQLKLHTALQTFARAAHGPGGWLDQEVMPILVDGGIGLHDWVGGPGDAMQHILDIDEEDSDDDLDDFEVVIPPAIGGQFPVPAEFQIQ